MCEGMCDECILGPTKKMEQNLSRQKEVITSLRKTITALESALNAERVRVGELEEVIQTGIATGEAAVKDVKGQYALKPLKRFLRKARQLLKGRA